MVDRHKKEIGSVLLGMLIVLVGISVFVVMDQMYDDEDNLHFTTSAAVEDINERPKS